MRKSTTACCCVCVLISLAAVGCSKSVDFGEEAAAVNPAAESTQETERQRPTGERSVPVSEQAANNFAEQITAAVLNKDNRAYCDLVSFETMAKRATANLGFSDRSRRDSVSGLVEGATSGAMMQAMHSQGTPRYDYLRSYTKQGQRHVLFRLILGSAVNYHDYTLKDVGGRTQATDLYVFLSGESLAATWRRMLLPMAKEQSKNWLQRLTSGEAEFVQHFKSYERLATQVRTQDFAGALSTYESMPASMQKDRIVMLLRYQAAMHASEAAYLQAAKDFRAEFPDAACIDLLMVDAHFLQQQFGEAAACLDRVQQQTGPDSYLMFLAATALSENGDDAKAMQKLQTAIRTEPVCEEAFWALIAMANEQGNHALTAQTLHDLGESFEMDWNDLRSLPEYADFVASPEGERWLSDHGF